MFCFVFSHAQSMQQTKKNVWNVDQKVVDALENKISEEMTWLLKADLDYIARNWIKSTKINVGSNLCGLTFVKIQSHAPSQHVTQ